MAKRKPPRVHDMRAQYAAQRIPPGAHVAAIDIEDPWPAATDPAIAAGPPGAAPGERPGAREWVAPAHPPIRVIASMRSDVAALMFARRQIDRASFQAARGYQKLHEVAALGSMKSADPSATHVSGGRTDVSDRIDAITRASNKLRSVEHALAQRFGSEGAAALRDVLAFGKTIEAAAREHGETTKAHVEWFGSFFRRCLKFLAVVLGLATGTKGARA